MWLILGPISKWFCMFAIASIGCTSKFYNVSSNKYKLLLKSKKAKITHNPHLKAVMIEKDYFDHVTCQLQNPLKAETQENGNISLVTVTTKGRELLRILGVR